MLEEKEKPPVKSFAAYEGTSFRCMKCDERIEDPGTSVYPGDCPVTIRTTIGIAPLHPMAGGEETVDVTDFAMPRFIRDLLARPVSMMIHCPECYAEDMGGLPMVDKEGNVVQPTAARPTE